MFISIYTTLLGIRLISNNSRNIEYEQCMINNYKTNCGNSTCKRLDTMLNDYTLSKALFDKYK